MMLGIVGSSVTSGRVIARTGRYRAWPIAGMAVAATGTFLLSRLGPGSGRLDSSAAMLVLGGGMGMVMQVLVLAVQNSVAHRHLGTATSAVNFFRSIGGTLGVALYGAIFAAVFRSHLPRGVGVDPSRLADSPQAIRALPEAARVLVTGAIAEAVHVVFLVALPLALLGLAVVLFLPEVPLRETAHVGAGTFLEGAGEAG
jgi:MFS family permease